MNCDTPLEHSHTSRGDSNLWQLEQYCCIEGLRSGNVCTKYCVNALADFGTGDPGGTSTDISCRSSSNAFLVKLCLIEYWKSSRWVMKTVIIAPGYKGVLWGWLHCSSAACKSGSLFSSSDDSKMLSSSPLLSKSEQVLLSSPHSLMLSSSLAFILQRLLSLLLLVSERKGMAIREWFSQLSYYISHTV